MEYTNLKDVFKNITTGDFEFPDQIFVAGVKYNLGKSSTSKFITIVRDGNHPFVSYTCPDKFVEQAKAEGMHQRVFIIWGLAENSSLLPFDIRAIPIHRDIGGDPTKYRTDQLSPPKDSIQEQAETIGDVVLLKIMLPSGTGAVKARVDTGAEISSLHCDGKPEIVGDTVRFTNKQISQNVISAPAVNKQAVQSSDGGVEYRPVIELDIVINGKPIRKALFNLNDRSEMEYPVLIGQNVLQKTNFLIDPKKQADNQSAPQMEEISNEEFEQLSEEVIQELLKDIVLNESLYEEIKTETSTEIYKLLQEANLSFDDLFRHVRTEALQRLDKVEY